MSIPYAFIKALQGVKIDLNADKRLPKEQAEFLMQPNHMRGKYLGACLDSCRWGSMQTVMWEMNPVQIIEFVQNWMEQNKRNFRKLFHELTIEEMWKKFEFPYLDRKSCHNRILKLPDGTVECGHYETRELDLDGILRTEDQYIKIKLKDFLSKDDTILSLVEEVIRNPELRNEYDHSTQEEKEDLEACYILDPDFKMWEQKELGYYWERVFLEKLEELKNAVPHIIIEPCRGSLSDKGTTLSLETIIRRLRIHDKVNEYCENRHNCKESEGYCCGHSKENPKTELYMCDGWMLAHYVQKWLEQKQDGSAPLFETKTEKRFREVFVGKNKVEPIYNEY